MIIKNIRLQNFRSHQSYFLDFSKQTTMIIGENGCGKTSVLEGIFEGCQGKSFKATDKDILKRDAEFYKVEMEFFDGEKTSVVFDGKNNKKRFFFQDKKTGRLPRKNKYPVVLFEPSDLNLIGSSPTRRRDYFDKTLAQVTERYSNSLSKFNKALKQRNELLKEEFLREDAIFSWDVMLAKYVAEIAKMRRENVREINERLEEVYRGIAENEDVVGLEYQTEVEDERQYFEMLNKNFQKDHILGHTSFGVHRDDYRFLFNGFDADGTASRGETRSIMLALKFIEAEILAKKLGKKPLILLDDVFSELDEKRQKCLVKNFKDNQVIITSVEAVDI